MLTAVDHVQLAAPAGSEDLLRAYYTDVLGMTEIFTAAGAVGGAGGLRPRGRPRRPRILPARG